MHEPTSHRIALVFDLDCAESATYLDYAARGWLCQLLEQLASRGVTATPVRVDIDGWPVLFR